MKTKTPNKPVGHSPFGGRGALQAYIAVASFAAAVVFALAGFCVPPIGDLTDSNLYLVAQFLLVTTSLFGVSSIVNKSKERDNEIN